MKQDAQMQGIAQFFQKLNGDLSEDEATQYAALVGQTARELGVRPTLMAAIIIYRAGDGTLSVTPASEYDGADDAIVGEIDPFAS